MDIFTMTKTQLMDEIVCNDLGLYECFDEKKFLANDYTLEELQMITHDWIMDGDECSDC